MTVLVPTKSTLKKYGLSEEAWRSILDSQGGVCAICSQEPKKGRLCIDHFHAKGWKKMPPEERVKWVRCLCCWTCNHYYLGRGITVHKSKNVTAVLEAFEERLASYGLTTATKK